MSSLYLLIQSRQWKDQNNVWNLFKINNKKPERRHFFLSCTTFNALVQSFKGKDKKIEA